MKRINNFYKMSKNIPNMGISYSEFPNLVIVTFLKIQILKHHIPKNVGARGMLDSFKGGFRFDWILKKI